MKLFKHGWLLVMVPRFPQALRKPVHASSKRVRKLETHVSSLAIRVAMVENGSCLSQLLPLGEAVCADPPIFLFRRPNCQNVAKLKFCTHSTFK